MAAAKSRSHLLDGYRLRRASSQSPQFMVTKRRRTTRCTARPSGHGSEIEPVPPAIVPVVPAAIAPAGTRAIAPPASAIAPAAAVPVPPPGKLDVGARDRSV